MVAASAMATMGAASAMATMVAAAARAGVDAVVDRTEPSSSASVPPPETVPASVPAPDTLHSAEIRQGGARAECGFTRSSCWDSSGIPGARDVHAQTGTRRFYHIPEYLSGTSRHN
eukprot:scaffold115661_cov69-Phaeocystis_antarctica.AAC.1